MNRVAALAVGMVALNLEAQHSIPAKPPTSYSVTSVAVPFAENLGPHFAFIRDRRTFQALQEFEWPLDPLSRSSASYTIGFPVSLVVPPPLRSAAECANKKPDYRDSCFSVDQTRRPVMAVGVHPIGLRFLLPEVAGARLFVSASLGLAVFDRDTPVEAASALNFSGNYEVGIEAPRRDASWVRVAWRFQHWSNADVAGENPGIDANLLYIGIRRARAPR